MRNTIAYERSGVGRSGGDALSTRRSGARLARLRRFIAAVVHEVRQIPRYHDEAERLRQGLRRAHSNSRERDSGGADRG